MKGVNVAFALAKAMNIRGYTEHKLLLLLLFKEKKSSRFDHLRDLTHGYFGPIGYPGALI